MPNERHRNARRDEQQPWRAWYKTAKWQKLRERVLLRDLYTCQRTGTLCLGKHPAPNSPVANHRKPHKGDPILFWDENNVETVMKSVHDADIQAQEKSGRQRVVTGPDGWPTE
jgi:5-methylcytosine-specific restriction protein A